jgi:hypothetical protein
MEKHLDEKLIPLRSFFSKEAHEKILLVAAQSYCSKSEWMRQLVLNTIGMPEEIAAPKTNVGLLAERKAEELRLKKEEAKRKRAEKKAAASAAEPN